GSSGLPGALPHPERQQDQQGSDTRGHDIAQRDRYPFEAWQDAQPSEQQAADQRPEEGQSKVSAQAEAPAVPLRDQPREASPEQADNDPDDDVVERRHRSLLSAGMFRHSGSVLHPNSASLPNLPNVDQVPQGEQLPPFRTSTIFIYIVSMFPRREV